MTFGFAEKEATVGPTGKIRQTKAIPGNRRLVSEQYALVRDSLDTAHAFSMFDFNCLGSSSNLFNLIKGSGYAALLTAVGTVRSCRATMSYDRRDEILWNEIVLYTLARSSYREPFANNKCK